MRKPKIFPGTRSALGVGILFLALSFAQAPAAHAETPSQFITSLGDTAISVLLDDTLTNAERVTLFRGLMVERFDLPLISRYVLGVHWRRASAEQKDEYSVLFEAFLVNVYSSRLGTYGGQTLRVNSTRTIGRDAIVATDVRGPGTPPLKVDWRVRGVAGNYKVVDIIIEGASMLVTQRDEFASVIRRSGGNLDGLLARLRQTTSSGGGRQVSRATAEGRSP